MMTYRARVQVREIFPDQISLYFAAIALGGRRIHGLNFEPANHVLFINALINDVHDSGEHRERSIWNRVRELF